MTVRPKPGTLREFNDRRFVHTAPPPGTAVSLQMAGILTGYGGSHYSFTPNIFAPHLVLKGSGRISCAEGAWEVRQGDVFALLPGIPVDFREEPDDPWVCRWMNVTGSGIHDFARGCGFRSTRPVRHPPDPAVIEEAMVAIWDSLEGDRTPHPYGLVEKLYHFAAVTARSVGALRDLRREETLVDRARVLIDAQLHTGINVTEIADLLRVGRTSLFCAFSDGLGMSPVQYLRRRRIARSRDLLAISETTLAEVARTCGFRNANYFMRTFKELTGQTPTQWRRERMGREG